MIGQLAELAQRSGRRLMVRLVKGAYWDSEIKRAQVAGRPDYPVYTTKAATDLSYVACARALIAAAPFLYAQFATHNAHSLAAVRQMAEGRGVRSNSSACMAWARRFTTAGQHNRLFLRTYAPVGGHEDLLPYLVRRLLENGANTCSCTCCWMTPPAGKVVRDPLASSARPRQAQSADPPPRDLYDDRLNSEGLDVTTFDDRSADRAWFSRPTA